MLSPVASCNLGEKQLDFITWLRAQEVGFIVKNGGVPGPDLIHELLQSPIAADRDIEGPRAILVHCKAGFGRSVVVACCLLIHWYDLPGRAVLGWARILRPGAITTVAQEVFLTRLRGRRDLEKYSVSRSSSG